MKAKLEAIANITVILVALAAGYVGLARYAASTPVPRSVAAGDRLTEVSGLDWKQHRRTLVLALNTGCHFCEESVPLYHRLADIQASGSDLEIVAVFPNAPEIVREFMTKNNLPIRSVAATPLENLRVNATPTLILVGKDGRVERSWVGMLSSQEELDLHGLASARAEGCPPDKTVALPLQGKNSCISVIKGQSRNSENGDGR